MRLLRPSTRLRLKALPSTQDWAAPEAPKSILQLEAEVRACAEPAVVSRLSLPWSFP
jgi:hypothetical protein